MPKLDPHKDFQLAWLSLRKAAISAACIATIWYCFSPKANYQSGENPAPMQAPELLPDRSAVARPLRSTEFLESFGIDSGVITASALMSPLPAAERFRITDIFQDIFQWPISDRETTILLRKLPSAGKYQIKGVGSKAVKLFVDGVLRTVLENGDDADATLDGTWMFNLSSAGQIRIMHDTESSFVTVQSPSAMPIEPRIANVSNRTHLAPIAFDPATPINVYDRYIHLTGNNVRPSTELQFRVFKDTGSGGNTTWTLLNTLAFPEAPVLPAANGIWDAVLEVPGEQDLLDGNLGLIEVLALEAGKYNVGTRTVKFKASTPPPNLQSPEFDNPAVTVAEVGDGNVSNASSEYFSNRQRVKISGTWTQVAGTEGTSNGQIVLLGGTDRNFLSAVTLNGDKWQAIVSLKNEGRNEIRTAWEFGDRITKESLPMAVNVRTGGPIVESVQPTNFASTPNEYKLTITFDEKLADSVVSSVNTLKTKFLLTHANGESVEIDDTDRTKLPKLSDDKKSVILVFKKFTPDNFTFTIVRDGVVDLFGNTMKENYSTTLFKPIGDEIAEPSRGITGATGPNVSFGEYTKPRPFINGFNPSDHVETRVSRLYYYRDAHRVAQIINRDVKSFNRAAVDMEQQLADKSRTVADQATDERRAKEREAVRAAEKTREAEHELQQAEANAQRAADEAANANAQIQQRAGVLNDPTRVLSESEKSQLNREIGQATDARNSVEQVFDAERRRAAAAADKVQALRAKEAEANERWQGSIAVESRAREEQFRREVAAAHADPDTYAPGKPGSEDPVRQVSVSVIGEGLIQLRGPIKGINIIRMMINQIDAPVGQVRVGVHTVQINGEKGDRMEVVASKIQRFVDHSRFLTLQSAEMLRKAIVQVATQRAIECGNVPGLSQADRDRSYLYSFFGEDFVRELETMDSEFLATGNKLLSIHSMDSTSLASALFIMALAKNTTRMQILQTFEGMMVGELPRAEQNYFEAGLTCDGKHKLFDKHCHRNEFTLLSHNARFQSIRGMFDVEIGEDDTMTPMQREFLRLAQIFKSQLIVEMELKQRVMERSVIEERLGDREKELADTRQNETAANQAKERTQEAVRQAQKDAVAASRQLLAVLQGPKARADEAGKAAQRARHLISGSVDEIIGLIFGEFSRPGGADISPKSRSEVFRSLAENDSVGKRLLDFINNQYRVGEPALTRLPQLFPNWPQLGQAITLSIEESGKIVLSGKGEVLRRQIDADVTALMIKAKEIGEKLDALRLDDEHLMLMNDTNKLIRRVEARTVGDEIDSLVRVRSILENYKAIADYKVEQLTIQYEAMNRLLSELGRADPPIAQLYQFWLNIEQELESEMSPSEAAASKPAFTVAHNSFQTLLDKNLDYEFAIRRAEASRRPLDHKKFLDMLVDEMEDKYIELLEGTRAHTANIDAYIKRLITSLDDDFNTQFYFPTFRKVREASQMWDVQMGQVETTNVLANNRAFAKVSPEATMEFDLPKRDILITEAMNGAKAMMDDVGALAQDPTFLAMAQMKSGAPTSSPMAGATGGQATVRNVLPGLSTDTAESVMGQQGPGGSKFGSAMEALIPDPAIYKFETGTGWEIRPVIQPDGQALVFHFNYMYTTNIREPVRADEKHLGRVKRHFVDTDVQLSNFELREISRYTVALKASRTSRGVPLFEDVPVVGALFRPLPSDESSLQQNVILGQATIFPTVFDLMGLRWAPVVADLDPLRLSNDEFIVRNRRRAITNRVFDHSSSEVDKFLRIPEADRRMDLYRSQETIPALHPNGYEGPGANLRDSQLQEGYDPTRRQESQFIPGASIEGSQELQGRRRPQGMQNEIPLMQPKSGEPSHWDHSSSRIPARPPVAVASAGYQSQSRGVNPQLRNSATQSTGKPLNAMRPANLPDARSAQARPQQMPKPAARGQSKK